jgi:REP element-mobilizing transposase RayT
MKYDPQKHHRHSIRLKGYDYSGPGVYFVNLCAEGRELIFGDIVDGKMILNELGKMVDEYWHQTMAHFDGIESDHYVIMPNHFHGIVIIQGSTSISDQKRPSLGQIMAYFKYQTTKLINETHQTPGQRRWQRNYYERIVRNEAELNAYRQYIIENPLKWEMDKANPKITERLST